MWCKCPFYQYFYEYFRVRIPDASFTRRGYHESDILFCVNKVLGIRSSDNVVGRGARGPGDLGFAPTEAERRANPRCFIKNSTMQPQIYI